MVLTHFGLSRTEFGSLITLHEASRCLVACKGGVWGLSRFWAIWGENPKNRLWGPVEAVSAKFSGDIKLCTVIPQPMSHKNSAFEPLSLSYVQNTGSRARWRSGLCLVTYQGGGFGDLAVFGGLGVKNQPKKKVSKYV